MLAHLAIKNVALIEKTEIEFGAGLNILSGETGAGKSMVIDALNFVLGERTSREFVRKGTDKAEVSALFTMEKGAKTTGLLQEMGLAEEEDGTLLVCRTLTPAGRTLIKVNGCTVTLSMLRVLTEGMIDIHGQHEHQSLLNPAKHIELLDQFCGRELAELKTEMNALYLEYQMLEREIAQLSGDERTRAQRLDLLQFQIEEIEDAALLPEEESALAEQKKRLQSSEKRKRLLSGSLQCLSGGEEDTLSAVDLTGIAVQSLKELSCLDTAFAGVAETVHTVSSLLDDAVRELKQKMDDSDAEDGSLEEIEDRLTVIYRLKRKYGNTIPEILEYCESCKQELAKLEGSEEQVKRFQEQKEILSEKIAVLCGKMTELRMACAELIQEEVEKQLWDLEMKYAKFAISIEKRESFHENGWDAVEFLISANAGEEVRPLAKIASGGEMSRIMLALKTVLADADSVDTFIFDEIDTGVSGRTAQKMAEKMAKIAKERQILCITHLPQIAAMADIHFLIEKKTIDDSTVTFVQMLNDTGKISEISRLMGGAEITKATIAAAKEMRQQACALKKKW